MPTIEKNKELYIEALKSRTCNVVFTKVDGTERFMMCTLKEDLIPTKIESKTVGRIQNENTIVVYDLEAKDWRSFRFDSVKWLGWA